MKREQEDVSVVMPAHNRRVHGMSALMRLDLVAVLRPLKRPCGGTSILGAVDLCVDHAAGCYCNYF